MIQLLLIVIIVQSNSHSINSTVDMSIMLESIAAASVNPISRDLALAIASYMYS